MEALYIILGIAAILGFVFFLRSRKKKQKTEDVWKDTTTETRAWRIYNSVQAVVTAAGHSIHYEEGLQHDSRIGDGVNIGVDKCFTKFECAYPNVERNKHRIHVIVLKSEPDSQGNPAFRVPINAMDPYYNSEWDKMKGDSSPTHYILAAGQTIGVGEPHGEVIIIPYSDRVDWTATVTEYEMEHCLLAKHDGVKFEETKFHQSGSGHPLVPDCPGEQRMTALRSSTFLCAGTKEK